MLRGQVFEIGGVVPGGEGVDLSALGLEDAGEFLRPQGFRTPEHQVFEEVADAGDALELKAGAHVVMELQGDHGHPGIGEHEQLEAVIQPIGDDGDLRLPGRRVQFGSKGHANPPAGAD